MVGCGCVLVLGLLAVLIYSIWHGLWGLTTVVAVIGILAALLGGKAFVGKVRKDNL